MKAKYIIIFLFLLSVLIVVNGCKGKRKEEEAKAYYEIAYTYYLNNKIDSAKWVIDSLHIKYPAATHARGLSNRLSQSIEKIKAMNSVDSISEIVNTHKTKRAKLLRLKNKEKEIELIEQMIDSLEGFKEPFLTIYNDIRATETQFDACRQCVIHMQNARNRRSIN